MKIGISLGQLKISVIRNLSIMLKKLLLIIFLLLIGFIYPRSVFAQNFTFDYDITYEVSDGGITQVLYNVTLINLKTEIYAQNYVLIIASENLTEITAFDVFGVIKPEVTKGDGQTRIQVNFETPVVGVNQKLPFTIKFKTKDLAVQKGKIWEILIPGVEIGPETQNYDIRLLVPKSFGQPAYSSPQSKNFGVWTLPEHQGQGISLAYGEFQVYDVRLKYYLENTGNTSFVKEITLPPDTPYQSTIIKRISEIPENVIADTDGNFLAQYWLKPNETKDIEVEAQVLTFILPQYNVTLTSLQAQTYTKTQEFWQLSGGNRDIVTQLTTAKSIYDYVVKNLTYDYEQVTQGTVRQGADGILNSKDGAVCLEFSDLFVALSRAKKIPARAIHGYAYTTNSRIQPLSLTADVLHAWSEYYDEQKKTWISVDPTWGNTTKGVDYFSKFDFNHIALAILGQNSDYPYPAGAFRRQDEKKTVFVDFAKDIYPKELTLKAQAVIPTLVSGTTNKAYIEIKNTGNSAQFINKLIIDSNSYAGTLNINITVPPFGFIRYPFTMSPKFSLTRRNQQLSYYINGQLYQQGYVVYPVYQQPVVLFGGAFLLVSVAFYLFKHGFKPT